MGADICGELRAEGQGQRQLSGLLPPPLSPQLFCGQLRRMLHWFGIAMRTDVLNTEVIVIKHVLCFPILIALLLGSPSVALIRNPMRSSQSSTHEYPATP